MNNTDAEKLLRSTTPEEREYLSQAETLATHLVQHFLHVDFCPLAAIALGGAIVQIASRHCVDERSTQLRASTLGIALGQLMMIEASKRFSSHTDDSTYSKADKAHAARLAKDALAKITGDMR